MHFCSLSSGSNGNCYYIESRSTSLFIDMGITAKSAEQSLREIGVDPASVRVILVTHEHSDHIKGVGVWLRRYKTPVLSSDRTLQAIANMSSLGTIPEGYLFRVQPGRKYDVENLSINTFTPFHDAADPIGYSVTDGKKRVTIMTDTGMVSQEMEDWLVRSDLAVVESNYDKKMLMEGTYPMQLKKRIRSNVGHLSNDDCGKLLARVFAKNPKLMVLLGHLSEENNEPELAMETVRSLVDPVLPRQKQQIYLAHRGERTRLFEV